MRELERFDALGDDGRSYTVVITQDFRKDGHGRSVPGNIYAHLSTGEVVEHTLLDGGTFTIVDSGLTIRKVVRP